MSDVLIRVGADTSAAMRGFSSAAAAARGLAAKLGGILGPVAALAGAFETVRRAAMRGLDLGGQLSDLSAQTGMSVSALHEMRWAFEQAGVSAESLLPAVAKMQRGLASGSAEEAVRRIGLSFEQIRSMAPEEQFRALGAAIAALPDPSEKTRAAVDIFGRSGAELLSVFEQGFDAIPEFVRKQAQVLQASADDLDAAGDRLDMLKGVMDSFSLSFAAMLSAGGDDLEEAANVFADVASRVGAVLGLIAKAGDLFRQTITLGAMELVNWIHRAGVYLGAYLSAFFSNLFGDSGLLINGFRTAGAALKVAAYAVADLVLSAATRLAEAASTLPGAAGDAANALANNIHKLRTSMVSGAKDAGREFQDASAKLGGVLSKSLREGAEKAEAEYRPLLDTSEAADKLVKASGEVAERFAGLMTGELKEVTREKRKKARASVPADISEQEESAPQSPARTGPPESSSSGQSVEDRLREMAGVKGSRYRLRAQRAQRAASLLETAKEAELWGESKRAAYYTRLANARLSRLNMSAPVSGLPGAGQPSTQAQASERRNSWEGLLSEIRDILSKIEPKLPTNALTY